MVKKKKPQRNTEEKKNKHNRYKARIKSPMKKKDKENERNFLSMSIFGRLTKQTSRQAGCLFAIPRPSPSRIEDRAVPVPISV